MSDQGAPAARPQGPIMEGVAARPGRERALHILPGDLLAPVRVIREADGRALRLLRNACEEPEAREIPGLDFVPTELHAHLWRVWGETAPLLRVMREEWVREWRGWKVAREELLGARDVEDRCRVVEDRTVKFMDFLWGRWYSKQRPTMSELRTWQYQAAAWVAVLDTALALPWRTVSFSCWPVWDGVTRRWRQTRGAVSLARRVWIICGPSEIHGWRWGRMTVSSDTASMLVRS